MLYFSHADTYGQTSQNYMLQCIKVTTIPLTLKKGIKVIYKTETVARLLLEATREIYYIFPSVRPIKKIQTIPKPAYSKKSKYVTGFDTAT